MARPQETFNKKDLEKRRQQKRKEKEQRKEERKANAKDGQSWETMMAYVDENGNITSTPPDPTKKKVIREEDIVTGSRNIGGQQLPSMRRGKVSFFNNAKGFGFIRDSDSGESIFVHSNSLSSPIQQNDEVTFETEMGHKGLSAIKVKIVK